jgi:hypothetical protein
MQDQSQQVHVSDEEARRVIDILQTERAASTRELAEALNVPETEVLEVVKRIRSEVPAEQAAQQAFLERNHEVAFQEKSNRTLVMTVIAAGLAFVIALVIALLFLSTGEPTTGPGPAPIVESSGTAPVIPDAPVPEPTD